MKLRDALVIGVMGCFLCPLAATACGGSEDAGSAASGGGGGDGPGSGGATSGTTSGSGGSGPGGSGPGGGGPTDCEELYAEVQANGCGDDDDEPPTDCDPTSACAARCVLDGTADVCNPKPEELDGVSACGDGC